MTEKDYKNLLNKYEIDSKEKDELKKIIDRFNNIFAKLESKDIIFESSMLIGSTSNYTAINGCNNIDFLLSFSINQINKQLLINIVFNYLENSILFSDKDLIINSITREYSENKNYLVIKLQDYVVNLYVIVNQNINCSSIFLANKKVEDVNNQYTYFKNTFKILKGIVNEQKLYISSFQLFVLLLFGLERYSSICKYENYIKSFGLALDDFINKKSISINDSVDFNTNNKSYQIIDPFTGLNLTTNVNDVNVVVYRKLKKSIEKLNEVEISQKGSSTLTLDINPIYNESSNTYSWFYKVLERDLSSYGGSYKNNTIEYKTASLKGLFRGLKAILESNNVNKNITINTSINNLLKCVEKSIEEQENNSRRKTITKYIEENRLNIKWNIIKRA